MASAALLSDANLAHFKTEIDNLEKIINRWKKSINNAETILKDNTGMSFKANNNLGAKAGNNIQQILDILQDCSTDLTKLNKACDEYYTKAKKASNK